MTKHLVRFQSSFTTRLRGDAGQGALEYIGILIIIGLLVVAVLGFVGDQHDAISTGITDAVNDFLNN